MYARFFALIAAFGAVMVYAQDDSTVTGTDVAPSDASATSRSDPPFPTSDVSPCPLACLIPIAAANNCTSLTNRHCVCDSTTPVTVQVTGCQDKCTQKELDNGAQLQQLLCPTTSGTVTGTSTTSGTATGTSTTSGTATGTSTNSSTGNSTNTGSSPTDTVSPDDSGAKLFTASGVVAAVIAAAVGGLVL